MGFMLAAVVGLLMLGGCQAPVYNDTQAFLVTPRPLVTSTEYRLAPPDVVLLTSKRVTELNGQTIQVRPDGRLNLPLVGTVMAAGRTPEELSKEIAVLAREFYNDAEVNLRVVGFKSKKIYVFGEVKVSGAFPYNGTNTVLDTMARAQPSRLADPSRVQVLRPNEDGQLVRRMTVDLNKMVREGNTSRNAVLEEGDVLFIPANPLAKVGLTVQQLLFPISPATEVAQGAETLTGATVLP
jgi:polysaccharide export outer membrane protein